MQEFLVSPIFGQANILLLLLTFGLAWRTAAFVREPEPFSQKVRSFWNKEEFLFGNWASEYRKKAGPWLFLMAAVLLQICAFFLNSLIRVKWPAAVNITAQVLEHLYLAALVLKIAFAGRYSGKQLLSAWCVYFVLRWTFFNHHNIWFLLSVLFLLAAKDVPLRKPLAACLAAGSASLLATAVLAITGLIPNGNLMEEHRPRYGFGYGWFNLLGAYLLGIAVMYLCWRGIQSLRWYDLAVLAGITVFCIAGPNSRGAAIALLLLTCGAAAARYLKKLFCFTWVKAFLSLCPILAFMVNYWIAHAYDPAKPVMVLLNKAFNLRPEFGHEALLQFSVKIAGQPIVDGPILDSAYIYLWLAAGPVASTMIWIGFSILLYKLLKAERLAEALGCLAFLTHGFMEPHLFWPCVNVTVWLMASVVFALPAEQFPGFERETKTKEKPI